MSTTKQVKVDNWGVFFLQRLKHFFNRTDYCDLTLQFQDYAQLKVHRLVLNACTEYFDLLERTCEMYDDCLIMPDDLQVDVVVPIVNFMYTGQLEYEYGLYDRLYSTAQIMNMTVLTKLLDAQKGEASPAKVSKKEIIVMNEHLSDKKNFPKLTSNDISNFSKKRMINRRQYGPGPGLKLEAPSTVKSAARQTAKPKFDSPRPTRYEVPEELENEDIFESSFADISYESRPLMRPARNKDSQEGFRNIYDEASCSRKFEELQRGTTYKRPRSSSSDTPEGKHIDLDQVNEFAYQQKLRAEYTAQDEQSDDEIFDTLNVEYEKDPLSVHQVRDDSSFLFNQISDGSSQSKHSKSATGKDSRATFNHAKIISEVLKKYPHLVKNNKNIKLKIMSGSNKPQLSPKNAPRSFASNQQKKFLGNSGVKISHDDDDIKPDWTYVSKNMNSEAMAKLVSLGAANTSGPWLCLMCGTPGKALNFSTYHNYYQHLVGVHKEKISANICEYCGYKSGKRNHLLHHLYTKHNVPPPSTHSFPKCNQCSYIALTEAFLIKHKLSHLDNREFSCNVCNALFRTRSQMLFHIQVSGHKISPDRKASNQCVYCNKIFLRETNLYTHLKLAHKEIARKDGIIDNSDEEELYEDDAKFTDSSLNNKYSQHSQEEHVNIKEEFDGKIQIVSNVPLNKSVRGTQKLLNTQLINKSAVEQVRKAYIPVKKVINRDEPSNVIQMMDQSSEAESLGNVATGIAASLGLVDRFVVLNDNEYILQSEQGETIEQTIGHVQVGLDDSQEIILSDLPGDEFTTQSTLEVSMPRQTSTSQIMSGRTLKTSQKVPPVRNYITSQSQPIQIMVSGNQQFKAIVSTAPVIYTTSNESKTTISPTFIQSPAETVQLQTTSEGTVMVLQDQDFNMTCTQAMPSDGSNIVVVYSHPLEADGKEYVQVDQSQFANLNEGREIESQIEQIEGDRTESEGILSEQGLVHETVETWQEETIENIHGEEKQDNHDDVTCSADMIIHQEIPLTEDEKVTSTEECDVSEEMKVDNDQILSDNTEVIESEPNEVVISSQESENQVSSEHDVIDNPNVSEEDTPDPNIEGVPSSCDQVSAISESLELNSTQQNEEDILQEGDVIVMDTDEAMEVVDVDEACIISNDISVEPVQVVSSIEHVEKIASEWSDDDTSPKKDSSQLENSSSINEEQLQNNQQMEVEESIENIEKEVQKHMQEKERESETQSPPEAQSIEETQSCNETPEDVVNSNEIPLLQEEHLEDNDNGVDVDSTEVSVVEKVTIITSTLKQKTVEKISTLLNDWEDNDSQPEAMEVDGKKETSTVQKDPHIDKLVSDWDDEDDK